MNLSACKVFLLLARFVKTSSKPHRTDEAMGIFNVRNLKKPVWHASRLKPLELTCYRMSSLDYYLDLEQTFLGKLATIILVLPTPFKNKLGLRQEGLEGFHPTAKL